MESTKPWKITYKPNKVNGYKFQLRYKCFGEPLSNPNNYNLVTNGQNINKNVQDFYINLKQNPDCATGQYKDADYFDGFESTEFWNPYKAGGTSEDWRVGNPQPLVQPQRTIRAINNKDLDTP